MSNCPMLCEIPPHMLMVKILKFVCLFINVIIVRLSTAPARLYKMLKRFPNRKPITKMRIIDTKAASLKEYRLSIKSTARFASPSLIPGMPEKSGSNVSTYPKMIASAEKSPKCASFIFFMIMRSHPIPGSLRWR